MLEQSSAESCGELFALELAFKEGNGAHVAVYALDAVALPQAPPITESPILFEAFFPEMAVFSPTPDA